MKDYIQVAYYVKEGNMSPDGKLIANNDNATNTWRIIAIGDRNTGWFIDYYCEWYEKDLSSKIGSTFYNVPVLDNINALQRLIKSN